jgi:hypothetical protein
MIYVEKKEERGKRKKERSYTKMRKKRKTGKKNER